MISTNAHQHGDYSVPIKIKKDAWLGMPSKLHMCKEGQAGNIKKQRRGLLVFS
jgi:hypothetical protein